MIAIKNGVDLHIPNIWLVIHSIHQFLALADIVSFNDLEAHEFHQFDGNNFWICDPWFNIHCRMHLYSLMTSIKSTQWESEGKLIFNSDHTELPTLWSQKLSVGKMRFIRMTDYVGMPTNEWWEWYIHHYRTGPYRLPEPLPEVATPDWAAESLTYCVKVE